MSILTVSTFTLGVVFVILYFLSHLALVILTEHLVCIIIFETFFDKSPSQFVPPGAGGGGGGVKRDVYYCYIVLISIVLLV